MSLLISCESFLLLPCLHLTPLILSHLYSSLLNRIPTHMYLATYFLYVLRLSFQSMFFHSLSSLPIPFSIASFLYFISSFVYPLSFCLIPSQPHPFTFLVTSFLCFFRLSLRSIFSHSLSSLAHPSSFPSVSDGLPCLIIPFLHYLFSHTISCLLSASHLLFSPLISCHLLLTVSLLIR